MTLASGSVEPSLCRIVFATLHGVHEILADRHRGNGTKRYEETP